MAALLVAGCAYDWRTRGRPHPVWLWGVVLLVLQFTRHLAGGSAVWARIGGWLIG